MINRAVIWLVGVSFVLFQFFLQLSSGVIIGAIMEDLGISVIAAGILSSAFYYVYTSMQIPVGILFDCCNARYLMSVNAFLCAISCFIFSHSHHLYFLIIGRLLMGGTAAFAFVGLSHLLRTYFPIRHFGFIIGLSETLGFIMTMLGILGLGAFVHEFGWRYIISAAGYVGLGIAWVSWFFLPSGKLAQSQLSFKAPLRFLFGDSQAWLNGIFVGLSFTVITVFGSMWAVPFIQVKLQCGLSEASFIDAMIFLGAAASCPLFGFLAHRWGRRKRLMRISCLLTAILLLVLIYYPFQNAVYMALMMFLIGICCGAYMLAFSVANELAPAESLSTYTGFTNTLAMITAPLFQPGVGLLLSWLNSTVGKPLVAYQVSLLLLPFSLTLAAVLVYYLPDSTS